MNIMKRNTTVTVISMLFLMCAVHTAGAMTVYVNDTSGVCGTTLDIPINVSGAPWQVGAMDISLTYNSSVLTALGVVNGSLTAGVLVMNDSTITKPNPEPGNWTGAYISDADNETVWNCGALANNTTATDGVVNISIISRYGFNGTGPIAMVRFEVIGSGDDTSPLTLSTVAAYNLSAPYNKSGYIPDKVNITDGYEPIYNTTENGTFAATSGDWRDEWMGPDSEEGSTVTTTELQDAIHHWLEDIPVRGHIMSTPDLQEIIATWLSG